MPAKNTKWFYLILLSLVWGSSFILIKKGLIGLTPLQLGSFRIIFAAIFLIFVGFKSLIKLTSSQWKWIVISGFLGSFFPVYLFSFAETQIDSSVASILNATTPLMTLIFGVTFFKISLTQNKAIGVFVGLLGSAGLIMAGASLNPDQNYLYSLLVVIAASCYAMNVNILKRYMADISAIGITAGNFIVLAVPALAILFFSGFRFQGISSNPEVLHSVLFVGILGVVGTGIAMIIFNKLIQVSDPVFSTSVTYTIPIIALGWGVLDGEEFSILQLLSTFFILLGVFLVNRAKNLYVRKNKI